MSYMIKELPVLPVKDLVVFPHIFIPISVGREISKNAMFEATENYSSKILILLQKDPEKTNPESTSDLYETGVICSIVKKEPIKGKDGEDVVYKLLVQGIQRAKVKKIKEAKKGSFLLADIEELPNVTFDLSVAKNKALYDTLFKDLVYIIDKGFVSEALIPVKELDNPMATSYLLLVMTLDHLDNQKILENNDSYKVVTEAYNQIVKQKNFINMKASIVEEAKESMSQSQKEYFLKEQMKAIRKELGEDKESDVTTYEEKFLKIESHLTKDAREEISKNIKKLKTSMSESYESTVTRNYLDYVFELPFYEKSEDNLDINKAKEVLDSEHCHLADVKERILEFLSIKKLNPNSKGTIICFNGPPGVGKTSIAKSIAKALNRKCIRIALGGVKDESEIRGHRKTYVGAMPGKIMQGMKQAGIINPIFVLDEIDKLSSDFRGDPSSALLEVLDPEQNNSFKDHYINLEYDLSKVMFIATANNIDTIPPALRDRMELISISGYCEEEKIEIINKFIIPKKVSEGGLKIKDISFSKDILKDIIRKYTKEFGVREVERQIARIVRKVAKKKAEGKKISTVVINSKNLKEFLGPEKFSDVEDNKNDIGVVTGLAWTPYGGEILKLESILIDEVGDTILTGRLGEVMQESAKIAISLLKNNCKKLKVDTSVLKSKRIHVHFPAGAVQKDGPSAGVALLSSMVSLLTNKKIKDSIAMTGEITLTGRVLPVGGIREKVLAAIRSGISLVIIPKDNKGDFENIPKNLSDKIKVKYVSNVFEAIKEVF